MRTASQSAGHSERPEASGGMSPPGADSSGSPGESGVSVLVVRGLVEAVEQAGVPRAEFLHATQLTFEQLDMPEARLPRSQVYRLCEQAMELTGDAAFGLHWAERLTERMFAPISHLIAHCSSLRQGLELLAQFFRLLSDDAAYRIVEEGDKVTVECLPFPDASATAYRFNAEMMMGGFWRLVRSFNVHARPERVSFIYAAPTHSVEYERIFEGTQQFGQAFTGLVFDRDLLNAPSPQKDDDVREALTELAERRLQRVTHRTPYAMRV